MPHCPDGVESLPPEVLNMICKYLDWRDVGNFEKALPQISLSGTKLDVVKRSLKEISNKRDVIFEEIVNIEIELERIKEHYFYSLFNIRYFTPHYKMHSYLGYFNA